MVRTATVPGLSCLGRRRYRHHDYRRAYPAVRQEGSRRPNGRIRELPKVVWDRWIRVGRVSAEPEQSEACGMLGEALCSQWREEELVLSRVKLL
jgi:hypothetical protein